MSGSRSHRLADNQVYRVHDLWRWPNVKIEALGTEGFFDTINEQSNRRARDKACRLLDSRERWCRQHAELKPVEANQRALRRHLYVKFAECAERAERDEIVRGDKSGGRGDRATTKEPFADAFVHSIVAK